MMLKLLPRKQCNKTQFRNRVMLIALCLGMVLTWSLLWAFQYEIPAANSLINWLQKDDSINHQSSEFGVYFGSSLIIGMLTPGLIIMILNIKIYDYMQVLFSRL